MRAMRAFITAALLIMLATGMAGATDPVSSSEETVKTTIEIDTDAPPEVIVPPPPGEETAVNPPSRTESAAPGKPTKYVVKPGDSLWDIATRYLGDGTRYFEIVEMNRHRYPSLTSNPNLIYAGWELDLPPDARDPSAGDESAYASPVEGTVRVGTSLNVRTSPWGTIIGSLHDGDKVSIIGENGDWYKISYNGQTAYVHANYVSTARKPAGQTPVRYPTNPTNDAVNAPPPVSPGEGRFGAPPCTPMPGRVSSEFGPRNIFGHTFHYGIDLPVPNGTRLNALGDGVVTAVGFEPGGGTFVKVRYDNGLESFYCHLQSYSVQRGQRVSMGQEIARSDNTGQWTTGPHLHMGIKRNGSYVNPRSIPGLPLP
ncbi:MAG: Peptidase, M23/M37 family [Candidatus Ozemobacter sibiricus]|uniref:Peptidase, M23/M37 family n=1 Tax=Candidatus Ozemobacter sibiricus TaxID=2268124 RepID=A0A367ZR67_9BACT|nr:MAG: Peptidase, M23/M37 family [Candidatus Ozemobacter sibiricus]